MRRVFRFTATEVNFEDLQEGDLFVLSDFPLDGNELRPVEFGVDLCYATKAVEVVDGVPGVDAEDIGTPPKRAEHYLPKRAEHYLPR